LKIVKFLASTGEGGLENVFVDLCNALSETIEVSVVVLKDSAVKDKFNAKVQVYTLQENGSRYNLFLYMELYKILRQINPELVHAHGAKASKIVYILNKILTFVAIASKHNVSKGKVFNTFPHVIAVSQAVKKSIGNNNVKVIYNGIPYKTPQKIPLKNTFNIVTVGSLRKVKGYDKLINAVARLAFDYHLTIIGEGEERKDLEALIHTLKLSSKISLIGFKSNVNDYLYSADLQVISSISEGFSLAMAEGILYAPVLLSTNVGVCTEILPDTLLYEMEDFPEKCTEVYENQEKYIECFNACKQIYSDMLSINVCAKEHVQFYEALIHAE